QVRPRQLEAAPAHHLAARIDNTRLDDSLMDVESHIPYHDSSPQCPQLSERDQGSEHSPRASGRAGWSPRPNLAPAGGPIGTYLFELRAQPGGPVGCSDTIASSRLVRIIEQP